MLLWLSWTWVPSNDFLFRVLGARSREQKSIKEMSFRKNEHIICYKNGSVTI